MDMKKPPLTPDTTNRKLPTPSINDSTTAPTTSSTTLDDTKNPDYQTRDNFIKEVALPPIPNKKDRLLVGSAY